MIASGGIFSVLEKHHLIIVCGSGGVGKTTTAAAIALELAKRGKKTLVVTIDPAKRLADAMGLDHLSSEPAEVADQSGNLSAMMLDAKATFDHLIEKYAPSETVRDAILTNRIYKHMSEELVGSQEYMAMEAMCELSEEGDYDHIVLDTPPTHHALDFLASPQRLMNFLDEGVIDWFFKPYFALGKVGFHWVARGSTRLLSSIEKLTGFKVLQELSEFFLNFKDMYTEFREHSEWVHKELRSDRTIFIAVTAPERQSMRELRFFTDKLNEEQMGFGGIIVNRVCLSHENDDQVEVLKQEDVEGDLRDVFGDVLTMWRRFRVLVRYHEKCLEELRELIGGRTPIVPVPYLTEEIADLEGLARIGKLLTVNHKEA